MLFRTFIAALLVVHGGMLSYSAYCHSPTVDEPAHLVAGASYWQLQRFDLYRVNPPLVRMVAAAPVLFAEPKLDWQRYNSAPGARSEFAVGRNFIRNNGQRSFWLLTLARWACIPFSLLGAWICFLWARDLHGPTAGLLALALWCFSPTMLGHGALITSDVAGAALAVAAAYVFWRWLDGPNWPRTWSAGCVLGLALLTKFTNVLFFGLIPLMWLFWRFANSERAWLPEAVRLLTILSTALVVLNLGYGFEGSFRPLGDYTFVSESFAGPKEPGDHEHKGNRFDGTWLANVPVPVPRNMLQGMDEQRRDFERKPLSYLRGEFRRGGWWYYYLYALMVKVPIGTWLLVILAGVASLWYGAGLGWRNEIVLLAPPVAFLIFVSSQLGFNHHLRYVLVVLPFIFIWASRLTVFLPLYQLEEKPAKVHVIQQPASWQRLSIGVLAGLFLFGSIGSSLWVYPHSLSYFNQLAGGPENGPNHLLDSNVDWGQDLVFLNDWLAEHPEIGAIEVSYFGSFHPQTVYPRMRPLRTESPKAGWYAVSVNYLFGYGMGGRRPPADCSWLRTLEPVARVGYSMNIYHLSDKDLRLK